MAHFSVTEIKSLHNNEPTERSARQRLYECYGLNNNDFHGKISGVSSQGLIDLKMAYTLHMPAKYHKPL